MTELALQSLVQLADVRLVRHRSQAAAGQVHGAAERRQVDDAAALAAADGRLLWRAREAVRVRRPARRHRSADGPQTPLPAQHFAVALLPHSRLPDRGYPFEALRLGQTWHFCPVRLLSFTLGTLACSRRSHAATGMFAIHPNPNPRTQNLHLTLTLGSHAPGPVARGRGALDVARRPRRLRVALAAQLGAQQVPRDGLERPLAVRRRRDGRRRVRVLAHQLLVNNKTISVRRLG